MNITKKLLTLICLINFISLRSTIEYLDTTFGTNTTGIVETVIGTSSKINGVSLYSNGQIVAAGSTIINSVQNLVVARYSSAGILDNNFGTNGITTFLNGTAASANAMAVDSNSNIVIVGTTVVSGVNNLLIVRFTPNGTLDLNFGTAGKVVKLIGTSSIGNAVVLDANGKILVTGTAVVGGKNNVFVARYNSNGTLDTTFGTSGVKTFNLNSGLTSNSIAIDQSARIIVGGSQAPNNSSTNLMVARLLPINGALDTTFGTNGIATTAISGSTNSVIKSIFINASSQIVTGGYSGSATNTNFTIARYKTNGTLDTTFGTNLNGIQITTIGSNCQINSLIQDLNNELVATGVSDNQFVAARYFVNGSLDTTFGINGILVNAIGTSSAIYSSLVQTSDGRIVVGGNANDSGQGQFTLVRYNKNNTDFVNTTSIANNSTINTKIPVVSGTSSLANGQVQVFINGNLFNTVATNSFGNWDAGTTNVLPIGQNNIVVRLLSNSTVVVSEAINFTVLDNTTEDSMFAYSTQSQSSINSNYTQLPFNNTPRLGTWSYANSVFTCNVTGTYCIEYSANTGLSGIVGSGTSSIDVATCITINDTQYLGSESDASIDLTQNFARSLTRSFVKDLNAGDEISFNFAVNIVGDNSGFTAGLFTTPNAIGTQPCYSLTITRLG